MMEVKQEVFNPPQVLKLPPLPHSWPWFNLQQIRAAGNCEGTPSFFLWLNVFTLRPAQLYYCHEVPEDGNGRQRAVSAGSPCGRFEAASGKQAMLLLYVKGPAGNYGLAMVENVFRSFTEVRK